MSSINLHSTFHYSQPEGYHFSHDSVFLARRVFDLDLNLKNYSLLDLCAGCGIIGLDFLFHCQKANRELPQFADFVDVQEIYSEHFKINTTHVLAPTRFIVKNYNDLNFQKYDLILCNPPYFNLGIGCLSPNQFKNRCRFFIDSTLIDLIKTIERLLKPGGKAFVLSRLPISSQLTTHSLTPIRQNLFTQIDGASTI